jgi:hypothetical protein
MPDSEPLPDAPVSIWASGLDAELYFSQIGMPFLAPYAANFFPRVVVIEELCALPPPATQEITLNDIGDFIGGGTAGETAERRMHSWVDRGLWEGNCRFVDDSEPDPIVPQDPPPGLPPGDPPAIGMDRMVRDTYEWMKWMVRNIVPRRCHGGSGFTVSGQGELLFEQDDTGSWPVWPAGVTLAVADKPDYVGRSNGGDFPVYYDLGWISLGKSPLAQPPIRVQHDFEAVYGSLYEVRSLYYNLAPGVTLNITPLWPDTANPPAE